MRRIFFICTCLPWITVHEAWKIRLWRARNGSQSGHTVSACMQLLQRPI